MRRDREQTRVYQAAWYQANRTRILSERSAYRAENIERIKAIQAAYYVEKKARIIERVSKWQKAHPVLRRQTRAKWKRNNPEYLNVDQAFRRARKLEATPKWANRFFIAEAYRLAKLRTKMLGFQWHVDHIVPLRHPLVCGLHTHTNLQVIPGIDNYRKNNRFDTEKYLNLVRAA